MANVSICTKLSKSTKRKHLLLRLIYKRASINGCQRQLTAVNVVPRASKSEHGKIPDDNLNRFFYYYYVKIFFMAVVFVPKYIASRIFL